MAQVHPENAVVMGHEQQPAQKEGMPQFNPHVFAPQLVWLAITFIALYVLLSRAILPRIGGTIEARRNRISSDLDEAARLKRETEEAIAAYEQALTEARGRAHAIAAEQRAVLMKEVEERTSALERELGQRTEAATAAILDTKQRALANVEQIATDAAAAIVEKLLGAKPDSAAVRQAVEARLRSGS